ncbi:MAG: transcription-repair coupling factor [Rhodospirillaceae bacterium]|nr:MAG: transcription-repair coupling factor [Rhodospirillaceae bacterium]
MESMLAKIKARILAGVPEGFDALILAERARGAFRDGTVHVARDELRLTFLADAVGFVAPDVDVISIPAWDCLPYDRVSPNAEVMARRIDALTRLAEPSDSSRPRLIITTANAALQRVPKIETLRGSSWTVAKGSSLAHDRLTAFLAANGYSRAEQVMEPGEFAVRGGLIDLFPPGVPEPVRIDLFGDEIESLRTFDPVTQRTTGVITEATLKPMSEVVLTTETVARFRTRYREMFGAAGSNDVLYESVSQGRKFLGQENWLPLFHDGLETVFDYAPTASISFDHDIEEAMAVRLETIRDYYEARRLVDAASGGKTTKLTLEESGIVYHPVPPNLMYLDEVAWAAVLAGRSLTAFRTFGAADGADVDEAGGRPGHDFADVRARPNENVFEAFIAHVATEQTAGRRVVLAVTSAGAKARLLTVLKDHGMGTLVDAATWADALSLDRRLVPVITLVLGRGFITDDLAVITEQDLLGDRLVRSAKKRRKADAFIADASQIGEGDLVVHIEHGIGRYEGLETVTVGGAAHDCLRLVYQGNDRLYVPVENIDVLSRFGSEQAGIGLDKLGGAAWQSRKAKLKERIRDMAEQLIRIAAERQVKDAVVVTPPEGMFDEFCARFPYAETDDQLKAISEALNDLSQGRPMDRLICGDVGFGKTEVALRAAFAAAMSGMQVAVVVPTTLLARQHHKTFSERLAGFPLRVGQLSRLVPGPDAEKVKSGIADGSVDVVVGTHALLAKGISFQNLGLLIIDEEQHFGVAHKERLKQIRAEVHVLTLTATPIPRTLQMALTGVRELSLIATPPVDRLAVRTFVLPFDPVVIREAILRERFRGGQTFYVCPRLADIDGVAERLGKLVPEVRYAIAHGQMRPTALEDVMNAFADGKFDVLISTNIIESGLDMPQVNTIIIHRADMFGLSQLYQLRGRVGRGKARGYAYLTLPPDRKPTVAAEKRLDVMQTLDSLGAGFSLASHDLDIRGAGNLLGDEQSGHIKEVGVELYQHLLEEAVAAARADSGDRAAAETAAADTWSPTINTGAPVLIPDSYVRDLGARLALYRRIAAFIDRSEIDAFAAELVDRFGPLPPEVENLLDIVAIKVLCRTANVEKVDAGPKGAVVSLRNNVFPNPAGLVDFISKQVGTVKLRPDHKLVFIRPWDTPSARIKGLQTVLGEMARLAAAA